MNEYKQKMANLMDKYPQYSELLFARGYLITDDETISYSEYPFFGNWSIYNFGKYKISVNVNQNCYIRSADETCQIAIIGHAYNPFNMIYEEESILEELYQEYKKGKEPFFEKVSELTGIHLIVVNDNNTLVVVQDCAGLKSCYYGSVNNRIYIASCSQLVADICNLTMDEFVRKLVNSRCYNIGNRHLPGDYTPYEQLKRLGPNAYLLFKDKFDIFRFYPTAPHKEVKTEEEYKNVIKKLHSILHNNIKLATLKWKKPAISLSGGMDSKTTLACANGLYDKFFYFSFYSKPSEIVDSEAAHKICENIGLNHIIYPIADNNDEVEDFDIFKKIIDHNTSYMQRMSDNEIRKYSFLRNLNKFDVEIKSWSSEIVRVFFERKYQVRMPELLNERQYSIFQTRYFGNKNLLIKSDSIYREFLKKIGLNKKLYNYESADLAYWEVRMGAWGTAVVSSQDFCHEITMPFNNRKLIDMFLTLPREERKKDNAHKSIIKYANKDIYDMKVEISNNYFKSYRIWLEKIYYYYRTIFFKSKM